MISGGDEEGDITSRVSTDEFEEGVNGREQGIARTTEQD